MSCKKPIRQCDEFVCLDCRLRWSVDEDKPDCPKASSSKQKEPTVTVTLNREDFWFILGSMNENVPCSDDMSAAERRTYEKIQKAESKLAAKLRPE